MYKCKSGGVDWVLSLRAGDLFGVAVAFPLTFLLAQRLGDIATPQENRLTLLNCLFHAGLVLWFFQRVGLYRWKAFTRFLPLFRRLLVGVVGSVMAFAAIRFFVTARIDFAFLPFLLLYSAVCFGTVLAVRSIIRVTEVQVLSSVRFESIAFVGWGQRMEKVLGGMAKEMGKFHEIVGGFAREDCPKRQPPPESGYKILGSLSELACLLKTRRITLLVVDQNAVSADELGAISDYCADAMANIRLIPATFHVWAHRLAIRVVSGVPVIRINNLHYDRFLNRFLKRALDIAGALVGLAISAPIIAVLAVLIRRESPGPVFFRQVRIGLHEKPFQIIKLRSMRTDAEEEVGPVWAVENDPRCLKIGKFMREWNLDELPQFWNVLCGDMSLVGPRPERPEFVTGFRGSVRYYNLRHTCKPGMTGWAAVHGLRGNTSLEDRLDFDLDYIENWSILLDIKIMLMTLTLPKNAY